MKVGGVWRHSLRNTLKLQFENFCVIISFVSFFSICCAHHTHNTHAERSLNIWRISVPHTVVSRISFKLKTSKLTPKTAEKKNFDAYLAWTLMLPLRLILNVSPQIRGSASFWGGLKDRTILFFIHLQFHETVQIWKSNRTVDCECVCNQC